MAQILVKAEDVKQEPGLFSQGLLAKFGQGGTLGWRDELSAKLAQGLGYMFDPHYGKYFTPEEGYQAELARQRGIEQEYQQAHPIASIAAEIGGGLALGAGQGAALARTGTALAPSLLGASALGAGEGAIYGAGAATEGERLQGAGKGALFGAAAGPMGYGLGRMANRITNRINNAASRNRIIQRGERAGYQYTPGQRSGLPELEIREAGLMRNPATARRFLDMSQSNQLISNRRAAMEIGEEASQLTEDVIDSAATRLEREFANLAGLKSIPIKQNTINQLADLEAGYNAMWGRTQRLGVLDDAIDEMLDIASTGGKLSADRYQYLHSQLGQMLKQYRKDPGKLAVVGGLRDILNDAVEDALGGNQLARWQKAREQWGNLQTLLKPGVIRDGNISEPTLYNVLRRDNPLGLMRGQSRQPGLERIATEGSLTKRKLQSSGTAEALAAQQNLRQIIPDMMTNARAGLYMSRPGLFTEPPNPWGALAPIPGLLPTMDEFDELGEGL